MKPLSIVRAFQFSASIILVIAIGTIVGVWVERELSVFETESKQMKEDHLEEQRETLRFHVGSAIDFARFMQGHAKKKLHANIKDRVYEAHSIALHVAESGTVLEDEKQKQQVVLDCLRSLHFNDNRSYYFAGSMNGEGLLFPGYPDMEMDTIGDFRCQDGESCIAEIIDLASEKGEGYVSYTLADSNNPKRSRKVAFIKHFEPFDWFIGTSEYASDIQQDIQQEVVARINSIRFLGENGYLFILSPEGKVLIDVPSGDITGKVLEEIFNSADSSRLRRILGEALENPDGAFAQYNWHKPGSSEKFPKLSYIKSFPDWNWLIGAGVYIDDVNLAIEKKTQAMKGEIEEKIFRIFVTILVMLLLVSIATKIISSRMQTGIRAFVDFFSHAGTEQSEIKSEDLPFSEFRMLADAANRMVYERGEALQALAQNEKKFRALAENAADTIMRFDKEGRHLYVNPAVEFNTGMKPEKFIGKTHEELGFPPPLIKLWEEAIQTVFDSGDRHRIEFQLPGGAWIDWLLIPEMNDEGSVLAVLTSARDISERKRIEEEQAIRLDRVKRQQEAVLNLARDVSLVDEDFNEYVHKITEALSATLKVDRASIWLFSKDNHLLYCLDRYVASDKEHQTGESYSIEDLEHYCSVIQKNRHIDSENALVDLRLEELKESYLVPNGIVSLIDTTIRIRGKAVGVISAEETNSTRSWYSDEKQFCGALADQIAHAILNIERMETEQSLHESLQTSSDIAASIPTGLLIFQYEAPESFILKDANIAAEHMADINLKKWQGREVWEIWPSADKQGLVSRLLNVANGGASEKLEDFQFPEDRKKRYFSMTAFSMPRNRIGVALDNTTDIKRAEEEASMLEDQLRQSQKMEAIGRLAGGVAHDFNNLLTGITGNVELALMDIEQNSEIAEMLNVVMEASSRATDLTRQLLTFSRRQIVEPKVINLNDLLLSLHKMLARLIGEDIELHTITSQSKAFVKVDPGQMEQIIINLAVNARDAMPNGGRMTIETSLIEMSEDYIRDHPYNDPGQYIMLAVSDTGSGIDEEVKKHIFEPFYTTKPKGKGTGLGLSMVYGAVKQNGGSIEVYSEVDQGTCFKAYFPALGQVSESKSKIPAVEPMPRGDESVLLVEDEEIVRELSRNILSKQGYSVLFAENGKKGLDLALKYIGELDLLLTDVVMPEMNGPDLADRIKKINPDIKILFMSGYTDDAIVQHGVLDPNVNFIGKPFSPLSLAQKVRKVLDS